MRRIACLALVLLLMGCAGDEGHRCLSGDRCGYDWLVCGPDNTCQRCGDEGDQCCAEETCDPDAIPSVACVEGSCVSCGSSIDEEPCCPGASCFIGFCSEGLCQNCGDIGEPCCPEEDDGDPCYYDGSTATCADGICVRCGLEDTPCCAGTRCVDTDKLVCSPSAMCESCGDLDEAACPDGTCEGWYQPFAGVCKNPFVAKPVTDAAICASAEPEQTRFGRDWCYWSAAFAKQDLTLCDSIQWSDAEGRCKLGKDPADFFIWVDFSP